MRILPFILMLGLLSCGASTTDHKTETVTTETAVSTDITAEAKPIIITEAEFKALVMDYENYKETWDYLGKLPCIVDFYADWCGPCRRVAPVLEELAKTYAGQIVIYKVNVDNARNLSAFFGIQSIPTFLFSPKEGNPALQAGAPSKEALVQIIDEFLLGQTPSSTN